MTTNKPKEAMTLLGGEQLIRLSDYEALQAECADMERDYLTIIEAQDAEHRKQLARLQAECERLRTTLSESRANDQQAMAYLSEVRAIVGGDDFPDMVRRCEKLQAECEKLRAAMIEAKGHISHYMYGGSSYREPAVAAIELIDDAMQEANP